MHYLHVVGFHIDEPLTFVLQEMEFSSLYLLFLASRVALATSHIYSVDSLVS